MEQIADAFANYIEGKGLSLDDLSLSAFPGFILNYYRAVGFDDVVAAEDGDLVLFQYGVHNWGDGEFFEVDFTRQLMFEDLEILQQSFTFYFEPDPFRSIKSFSLWSHKCLDIDAFDVAIRDTE